MDGETSTTQCVDTLSDASQTVRLIQLLKDNRIEMMVATILLYSTGILEKSLVYAQGVC